MVKIIITSSLLILIIIALRFLLRRRLSPSIIYALWAFAALRLLLPFSVGHSKMSIMTLFHSEKSAPPAIHRQADTLQYLYPDSTPFVSAQVSYPGTDIKTVLTVIWLCGAAAVLIFSAFRNIRMYCRLRASRKALPLTASPLKIYAAEDISSPMLFGFVKPSVYINSFVTEDRMRFNYVITHELTHYRHGDHIWALVRILCIAIYWFNPLVWLAAYLSRQDGELACDSAVIKAVGDRHSLSYGRTLVDMLSVRLSESDIMLSSTTMSSDTKSIKERITMLKSKPKTIIWAAAAVVLAVAVALVITFTAPSASASDTLWDDAALQYLLEDVPVFESGNVTSYAHYVKGNVYKGDSFVPEGYAPNTDMLIIQFEGVSGEYVAEYTEKLAGAGFTYFAEKLPDEPEIPNIFIAYNAPADGIGVQLEVQENENLQMTVFSQGDDCYGIYDDVPKG